VFSFIPLIHASLGTVLATIRALVGKKVGEYLPTGFACTQLGPMSTSIPFHCKRDFIGSDRLWMIPGTIALMARGHEVISGIVSRVAVKMVNCYGTRSGFTPRLPGDRGSTPIAGMDTWPKLVEENEAMFGNAPIRFIRCQEMVFSQINIFSSHRLIISQQEVH
jgi:hypothetical protein